MKIYLAGAMHPSRERDMLPIIKYRLVSYFHYGLDPNWYKSMEVLLNNENISSR